MSQKVYYHNLTKGWFNENDYGNAVENSEFGDIIKFSIRGSALIFDLLKEDSKIEYSGQYEWARDKFLDYFEKFHGQKFNEWNINYCLMKKHNGKLTIIDCGESRNSLKEIVEEIAKKYNAKILKKDQ